MAFEFKMEHGLTVPEVTERNQNAHTFPWSLDMKHGDGFTVPFAYWSDRGMEKDKYSPQFAKDRIRSNFKSWQAKQEGKADKLKIVFQTTEDKSVKVFIRDMAAGTAKAPTGSKAPAKKGK